MNTVSIDFSKFDGKIKPMHAVNNGPLARNVRGISNFDEYQAAGIPYARNHDASFYSGYGGEHTVDVNNIFKNFSADENLPESYDFEATDKYLNTIRDAGTAVFYRLGSKIEHDKKMNTYPPKDFHKWARICEHIIRHYNEGWANGFHMNIEYWEIWNEPDCGNPDCSNPCWQGTDEQFIELFVIAQRHLKACFPKLKIGGPAFTRAVPRQNFADKLLSRLQQENLPLDFYSFHKYCETPDKFVPDIEAAKELVTKYGYDNAELILNEWNYVRGWLDDDWIYSLKTEKGLKGSSFIASTMCACQHSPLNMLMYYDARPCGMNGMFSTDFVFECLKGYYPFKMFNELYKLGNAAAVKIDCNHIYACAASSDNESAVIVSYFDDDDNAAPCETELSFKNFKNKNGVKLEYYLLDETHDAQLVRSETFMSYDFSSVLNMTLYSTYLIKIKAL